MPPTNPTNDPKKTLTSNTPSRAQKLPNPVFLENSVTDEYYPIPTISATKDQGPPSRSTLPASEKTAALASKPQPSTARHVPASQDQLSSPATTKGATKSSSKALLPEKGKSLTASVNKSAKEPGQPKTSILTSSYVKSPSTVAKTGKNLQTQKSNSLKVPVSKNALVKSSSGNNARPPDSSGTLRVPDQGRESSRRSTGGRDGPGGSGRGFSGGPGGSGDESDEDPGDTDSPEDEEDDFKNVEVTRRRLNRSPISLPSSERSLGEITLLTAYSEPPFFHIRRGRRRLSRDRDLFGDHQLYLSTQLLLDCREIEGKRRALMLYQGQGGTFGFGNTFKDEKGKNITINGQRDVALTARSKTKHLLLYGKKTEFIGTTGCITCVGVYFEIKGNRCFCAHINAWHRGSSRKFDKDTTKLTQKDPEYSEIWQAIYSRFDKHSAQYGWRTSGNLAESDYIPGTLKLVCPHWSWVGHCVISSICAFLCLGDIGETIDRTKLNAQGLAVVPGAHSRPKGGLVERFQHRGMDPEIGNITDIYENLPDQIEKFEYTEDNHALFDLQPWTYSARAPRREYRWTFNKRNGNTVWYSA